MSSRRPRRSRIYDSNYNIGENYYRSAIDRLDEKYFGRSGAMRHSEPPVPLVVSPPRTRFNFAAEDDEEDLEFARDRASRAIQKETVLDQRFGRRALDIDSSFDGQVCYRYENYFQITFITVNINEYLGTASLKKKIFASQK